MKPWEARRNLSHTNDRVMFHESKQEAHPMRYALHYRDGVRNIKVGRLGLIAEIWETKPISIQRLA